MSKVCLVGATSHIAKALIAENARHRCWSMALLARAPARVENFLRELPAGGRSQVYSMGQLVEATEGVDAIINCVGFGTPEKVRTSGLELFTITDELDGHILNVIAKNRGIRYVNFSSGAVYGTAMEQPVKPGQRANLDLSPLRPSEFYRISKIHQEAKHRSCPELAIVDIRLFSFFSRFIDQDSSYLMCDVIRSLASGNPLKTTAEEIYRDFISPLDLYSLVNCILSAQVVNAAVDTYSSSPISKTELISNLRQEFDLQVEVVSQSQASPTGSKAYYYSENFEPAESIGYRPKHTSWESIRTELDAILQG